MAGSLMDVFVKIGADTSGLESGIDKAKGLAGGLGSAIGTGLKVAGAAIGVATTAVGAFAKSSIDVGKTFDSSMSQVAATMGVTVDEISELRDFAMDMGAKTAFSATQAADALNYMALAGYEAEDSMKMLPNVLNLAAAGDMDLARASDMVTDAQSALGLEIEDMTGFVDQLAKTSSKSNTSVQQLGDAILTIGGTAKTLAGGTTELNTALGILADNGIKGAEGGTKLRNVILSLSAPTDTAAKELERLGVKTVDETTGNLRELEDIMADLGTSLDGLGTADKAEIISTIFNKQDIAAVNALLDTDAKRWDELSSAIKDSKDAAEEMAKTQLNNLEGDITLFKSALEGAKILVSDALTPALRDFVKFGTDGLTKISDGFKEGGLSGAMGAFKEVLTDGIAMVTDMIPDAIKAGMELLGAVGQGILDNLPALVDAAVQVGVMFTNGLVEAAPELARGALTIIESLGNALSENSGAFMDMATTMLDLLVSGLRTGLPMLINFAVSLVRDLASYISENGAQMVTSATTLIREFVSGFADAIPDLMSGAADLIVSLVLALTDPGAITQLVMAAADIIMGLANGLLEAIPKLIDAVPQIISNLVAALIAAIPQILMVGIQLIIGLATGLIQAIPRIVAAVPALILALVGGLKRGIEQIVQVGRDMVAGLWKGIKERWSALVEDFKNLASGLVDGVKGLFGINSPSKVFAEIGRQLDAGLAKGINENVGLVDKAMSKLEGYTNFEANGEFKSSLSDMSAPNGDVVRLLQEIANKDLTVVLEGDMDRVFRVMQSKSRTNHQITGQPSFA